MDVIHKKNRRLHIYVRQDKYKGELKSHNWVGRTFIDGKQKIFSSGTTNLEEATPILEKWFDDLHANKEQSNETHKAEDITPKAEDITPKAEDTTPKVEDTTPKVEDGTLKEEKKMSVAVNQSSDAPTVQKSRIGMFEKLRNIKFSKPDDNKKVSKLFGGFGNKLKSKLTSRLGKASIKGEEILGVEITVKEIRLAQVASNKANQWM